MATLSKRPLYRVAQNKPDYLRL